LKAIKGRTQMPEMDGIESTAKDANHSGNVNRIPASCRSSDRLSAKVWNELRYFETRAAGTRIFLSFGKRGNLMGPATLASSSAGGGLTLILVTHFTITEHNELHGGKAL
jgi:hypothetical protein